MFTWTLRSVVLCRNRNIVQAGRYCNFKMTNISKSILWFLAGISLISGYCPYDRIHAIKDCEFRITCFGTIRGPQLSSKCLESTNYPVSVQVHVNLIDAIDKLDNTVDIDFLKTITSLEIAANWPVTNLTILKYTPKLQTLNLAFTGLEKIIGKPFSYLSRLEDLNLSHNKLTEINELFDFENKLVKLSLAHNAIKDITKFAFTKLISLKELDLSYNRITDLSEEPFSNLTKLEVLKLNDNKIKDLNGALNNLWNLKHLYLRGNQIQNVDDESLKVIEHLETFDVSRNQLQLLKPVMFSRHWNHFSNHSVCKIILSENHISSVPNGTAKEVSSRYIRNLDKHSMEILTELDLSINCISDIKYNAFQSLIRVVFLNLSKNKIKHFLVNPEHLMYIQYLNLSSNDISHLYFKSFYSMYNLQKLDLSHNKLDFIPDMTFNHNNNLKVVNMTHNELQELEGIHITMFHPNGGILDLSNNGLFKLKVPFGEGIRLVTLILHSNNITNPSLIDLRKQTDLKRLDMSKNFINELNISSLFLPVSLLNLNLSHNNIQKIGPSTFHTLGHLETLLLGHNKLSVLEYGSFQGLFNLHTLDLSFNQISFLDSKLLMDLKSLQLLSLKSNDMTFLDYSAWYGHKFDLSVYIDSNKFSCDWLAKAMNDFNMGYSKMRPTVLVSTKAHNSVEGVPCVPKKTESYIDASSRYIMSDDRLLVTSKKILETLREQNYYLKKFIWRTKYEESEKSKK